MSSNTSYKTLSEPSSGVYKEKGSRFYSYAYPIDSEDDVKIFLQKVKTEHHSARHHCFAYLIGKDGAKFRANDDGEPSGTAGKPILGQINSNNLTNVLIIVVRYFGGRLLGTSGLIRAYKAAAADAIRNGKIVVRTIKKQIQINFPYPLINEVMKVLKQGNYKPLEQEFGDVCKIFTEIPEADVEYVSGKLELLEGISINVS